MEAAGDRQENGTLDSRLMLVVERVVIQGIADAEKVSESNYIKHNIHVALGTTARGAVAEAFQYLKTLFHPNVCCYTDLMRTKDDVYILVSEGYSQSLEDVIKDYIDAQSMDGQIRPIIRLDFERVAHEVICGLQFLHANGIPHGALGLHNIFIHSNGTVKLGCYAHAYLQSVALGRSDQKRSRHHTNLGHYTEGKNEGRSWATSDFTTDQPWGTMAIKGMLYRAPEVLDMEDGLVGWEGTIKNDVWSLGICILQIIACIITCETIDSRKGSAKDPMQSIGALQTYESVMNLSQCIYARPAVMKAFIAVAAMLKVVKSSVDPSAPVSVFGIDVISMCEEALSPIQAAATNNNSSTRLQSIEERIMQLVNILYPKEDITITGVDGGNDASSVSIGEKEIFQISGKEVDTRTHAYQCRRLNDVKEGEHVTIEAVELVRPVKEILEWIIGRKLVGDLVQFTGVDLNKGETDPDKEKHPSVAVVYYLLRIAHKCLIINPDHRIGSLDILAMIRQEEMRRNAPGEREMPTQSGYSWNVRQTDCGYVSNDIHLPMSIGDFLNRKYQRRNLGIAELDRLEVSIDDIFYFWRLMGNDPVDVMAIVGYESPVELERYSRQTVSLEELLKYARRADLFPMIIEHQIRPTCGYARQFTFLYQWIRMRRFERLLGNGLESKSQIMLEAQLDVPPILRKQIWCVLIGIYAPHTLEMNRHMDVDHAIVTEIRKTLIRYDNDLLYSERCMLLMTEAVRAIKETYSLESLPSSIYVILVHLVLLYFDFTEILVAAVMQVFDKYLKYYYVPSGSFVQNELAEFHTMLNFFDPEVAAHMRRIGAFAESFVLLWFMTLFAEAASSQQVFVLWDTIFSFPRTYLKYIAVVIINSVREGILETSTAASAIAYISGIMDSINVPMLNYTAMHMHTVWDGLLFHKESSRHKRSARLSATPEVTPASDVMSVVSEGNSIPDETCNLDRITFAFNTESYPCERCFKVALRQFSELLDTCIIVDLRPFESYKLGHIPNSCHIERLFACMERRDDEAIAALVTELLSDNQGTSNSLDANRIRKNQQLYRNFSALLSHSSKVPTHDKSKDTTILLAAGDGAELENEMQAIQRLVFELHVPHVCYYRINGDDWPKFFTLSQI